MLIGPGQSPVAEACWTPDMAPHLLLIDDDARLTGMVGDYLRQHGFTLDCAGSLTAGRQLLEHGQYDALLLDLIPETENA